jgi:hypothetical protein
MKSSLLRRLLYVALFVLYLLHNDLWLWYDPQLVLGLPIGLLYHIGFCLAAAVMMALLVNYAWPRYLRDEEEKETNP